MTHGSLFSGIGGFDLAAEWMGWENIFHVENNEFCNKILKHYWPDAISYTDIITTDFTKHRGAIDIITGGFPCQPFSASGTRKGKKDNRYLWPEMLRAVREIEPRWVVAENVYGLFNIDNGITPGMLCADLEVSGYQRPVIFDCAAYCFGLPTLERHIWFITEAIGKLCKGSEKDKNKNNGSERKFPGTDKRINNRRDISKTRFCDVGERVSRKLASDQRSGLVAGGNAVSPQVVFEIFKAIEEYH